MPLTNVHAATARHARRPAGVTFAAVALAVVVIDAGTKRLAPLLASSDLALGDWARFTILHNDRLTGGASLGASTALVHAGVLLLLVSLMIVVCRPLSEVDDAAPLWLGLLAGAALGNGAEVVAAAGATDFLALRYAEDAELVGNLADVAACAGFALLLRCVYRVTLAIRRAPRATVATARAPVFARDVAVPLLVYREPMMAARGPAPRAHDEPSPPLPPRAPLADARAD